MWLKKNTGHGANGSEVVGAVVMPLGGHSDEEVARALEALDAEVTSLGRGFLSVKASRQALAAVSEMARVELKPLRQMH